MTTTLDAGRAGESGLDLGVRVGLVAYGVTHLVIAGLAVPLAFGDDTQGRASQQGALAQLAGSGAGQAALLVAAVGFAALTVWQGFEAWWGHRRHDGASRALRRVASAGKAVVFAALAASCVTTALSGSGGSGGSADHLTAQVMDLPGGRLLVGAAGGAIVAVGSALCWRGVTRRFTRQLDVGASRGDRRTPIVWAGTVGHLGKGSALVAVGALPVVAAVRHQPQESGGLDVALHELVRQPFGPALVLAVALGLACFGLYCFAWARHLRR